MVYPGRGRRFVRVTVFGQRWPGGSGLASAPLRAAPFRAYIFTSSTRRFVCLPSALSFATFGFVAPSRIDALGDEVGLDGRGSFFGKRLVCRRIANVIRVSLDHELEVSMILQHARDFFERGRAVRLDDVRPGVEEDSLRRDTTVGDERVIEFLPPRIDGQVPEQRRGLLTVPRVAVEVERQLLRAREVRVRDIRDASFIEIDLQVLAVALDAYPVRFADSGPGVLIGKALHDVPRIDGGLTLVLPAIDACHGALDDDDGVRRPLAGGPAYVRMPVHGHSTPRNRQVELDGESLWQCFR